MAKGNGVKKSNKKNGNPGIFRSSDFRLFTFQEKEKAVPARLDMVQPFSR
jgi:hypothetical protein